MKNWLAGRQGRISLKTMETLPKMDRKVLKKKLAGRAGQHPPEGKVLSKNWKSLGKTTGRRLATKLLGFP